MIDSQSTPEGGLEIQTDISASRRRVDLQLAHELARDTNERSTRAPARTNRRDSEHMGRIASLASYIEILFVHRWLLLSTLLVSCLLAWVALLAWPRSYMSEAKLMLRVGRETVALDPTATTSQTLLMQKTQEEEVNSALEILSSRQLAELVVGKLGVESVINGSVPSTETTESSGKTSISQWLSKQVSNVVDFAYTATGIRDTVSDQELAVQKLQKTIAINAPKKSTVVTIRADSKSPEMAQAIARTLTDEFLEEHVKVSATVGSLSFFEEQAKEAEHKLSDMLMKRSGLLKERKISSVAAQHETLGSQLGSLEKSLLSAQSSLQQSMAEINDLEGKASSAELEIVATKQKQGDQTWSLMRNKLYELEMEESRLASQYTPSHARLGQVREQLTGAKLILSKLESEREDHSTTLNPVRLRIEEDLQRTKTAVAGLESMIAETESQRKTKQQEIRELLDFEVMLGQLDREIAVSESSLRLLQEKQEEARVIDELRGKHISSIGVFQPASFVERPVSPKKPVLAAAFGLMGLLGGIGWVFMREMTSTTFRTPEHVERDLELPVLSTIPFSARLAKLRRFPRPQHLVDIRVSCRSILSEILLSRPMINGNQYQGKTIGILGVEEGGGASTVAVGLALASSEDAGLRTTLIDFDLTKRTVSSAFDLNGSPGFAELVSGEADQEDCVQHFKKRPLSLIAGSSTRSNRRFEAEPLEVMRVLNELRDANALVIVDLPPASRPDQTLSIAQHIDHVIVVIESEKTGMVEAKRLIRQLEASNADVVGIILNKSRTYLPIWLSGLLR